MLLKHNFKTSNVTTTKIFDKIPRLQISRHSANTVLGKNDNDSGVVSSLLY